MSKRQFPSPILIFKHSKFNHTNLQLRRDFTRACSLEQVGKQKQTFREVEWMRYDYLQTRGRDKVTRFLVNPSTLA